MSQICKANLNDTSSTKKTKNLIFSGIVLPAHTPQNGWYGQGGLIGIFKTVSSDTLLRASNLYLFGLYSQYNQLRISIGGDVFFPKEKYYVNFWYYYSKFPDIYYGTGSDVNSNRKEFINYKAWYFNTTILRQLQPNVYLGLMHTAEYLYNINYPSGGIMETNPVAGSQGYLVNGLGPRVRLDTRNNIISTIKGFYLDYYLTYYMPISSKSYEFLLQNFESRWFIDLSGRQTRVLALQALISDGYGSIPFRFLPNITNKGYNPNLFRNNKLASVQAEFRFYFYKRLGATIFCGAAFSSDKWINGNNIFKPNAGAGLRFRAIPKYNLNIRVDAGIGANGWNGYLSFSETF